MSPFLNTGGVLEPLIVAGGCPCGPVVAAHLLVSDYGAEFCLFPSSVNGVMGTTDCTAEPELHPISWRGYSSLGTPPCESGNIFCGGLPVEETSWGRIKGAYR